MRRAALIAGLVAALVIGGIVAGAVPLKASSGHLAVTEWVLDFVKRRSVSVRASTLETPPLDDAGYVRLGAAHFDRGCRPCHGAPGELPPVVPLRMTPHPPDLAKQAGRWRPRELFYLVAHGVKFTGMPAWPSPSRTDEAWAVVAFLRHLPALDAAGYRRLARGDGAETAPVDGGATTATASSCLNCHSGALPLVPRLSGQSTDYVADALDAYADARRYSGIMQPIAAALDQATRRRLAGLVTAPAELTAAAPMPGGSIDSLLADGDPARDVPPCLECHAAATGRRDPRYPVLAGLSASYLHLQLTLFAEGRRGGSPAADIMRPIAARLTARQRDVAAAAFAAMETPR